MLGGSANHWLIPSNIPYMRISATLTDFMMSVSLLAGRMSMPRIISGQWVNSVWLPMREGRNVKYVLCCWFSPWLWGVAQRRRFFFFPLILDSVLFWLLISWDFSFGSWKVEERENEDCLSCLIFPNSCFMVFWFLNDEN